MWRRGEEAHFGREWDRLQFRTGAEEQDGPVPDSSANVPPVGTREGRVRLRNRAGVAVGGVLADGSQERGARGDEALEEGMRTGVGEGGSRCPTEPTVVAARSCAGR